MTAQAVAARVVVVDVPPLSVAVELGVQSQRQEIGHEEAIHGRTDHWLPSGS